MSYTRETEDDDWEGTIHLHGEEYPLTLRCSYEDHELDEVAGRAKDYLESHWQQILDELASGVLFMFQGEGAWLDEGTPPPDKTSILHTVEVIDINVWEEESIMLNWADGGLLGNHYITVFIEGPEQGRKITLGMEG